MKTIDEAIMYCERAASHCDASGSDMAQMAAWLRELKERRDSDKNLIEWIAHIIASECKAQEPYASIAARRIWRGMKRGWVDERKRAEK